MIEVLKGDVAPGAQSPPAYRMFRVPLDGDYLAILYVGQDAAILMAEETTGFPYCRSFSFQVLFAAQSLPPVKYV
jgi:hypothetical protein